MRIKINKMDGLLRYSQDMLSNRSTFFGETWTKTVTQMRRRMYVVFSIPQKWARPRCFSFVLSAVSACAAGMPDEQVKLTSVSSQPAHFKLLKLSRGNGVKIFIFHDVVSPSSFQPVKQDTPTDVITVRTSGQKNLQFWFQLRTDFLGFDAI